jgi:arylsulfatase
MPWDEVENKDEWDLRMAVYAAMVDRVDQGLARVVDALERNGQFENTLILFMSDNGACAETFNPEPDIPPGPEESSTGVWLPWANASNTPLRLFKHFAHEGGIATPMIAHWPAGITAPRIEREYAAHVKDIMGTCLELAGAEYPNEHAGRAITGSESRSFAPVLTGPTGENPERIFWEHEGNRAVRDGRWKLVSYYSEAHGFASQWGVGVGCRTGAWELYDIASDPSELTNLIEEEPERASAMMAEYEAYAERTGVVDWQEIQRTLGKCDEPATL